MPPAEAASFLHIADIHFWKVVTNPLHLLNKRVLGNANVWLRRGRQFRLDRAEEHADRAAATGIREAVLTGDFTSTATDAEFAMARAFVDGLRARGMTVHLMPGNHDVYTFESARRFRFERHFHDLLPGGGYPARMTLGGGVPLLLLPTVRPNWLSSRGEVHAEAVSTAEDWLGEAEGPVVAAGHYPLLHTTSAYASGPSHRAVATFCAEPSGRPEGGCCICAATCTATVWSPTRNTRASSICPPAHFCKKTRTQARWAILQKYTSHPAASASCATPAAPANGHARKPS